MNCYGNQVRNGKIRLGLLKQQLDNCKSDEELEMIKKMWGEEQIK